MSSKTYILRKGHASLSDLSDGNAAVTGYPGDYAGRVYYVNNTTGSDSGSGLSWGDAFATIQAAIDAAEVYRLALLPSTNVYYRNTIFIQATATDYTKVTAYPNYTDIIGVGADPRGNGGGIVVITGGGAYDACGGAAQRGNNWANLQFKVDTDAYWCFDSTQTLRTTFVNCAFMCATGAGMTSGGGFRATGNSGGIVFRDCHFGTNGAGQLAYGIYFDGAITCNNCLIENNHITAVTAGIYTAGATNNATNTIVRRNTIGGGTSTQVVTGIAASPHMLIMDNCITAGTDAISGATAVNTVFNHVINNATAAQELA